MLNITDVEAAYIAGFIDGDGCISVGHSAYKGKARGQFVVAVIVDNVDPRPVRWIQGKVGGCVWTLKERGNKRAHTRWQIVGTACEELIRRLLPYFINKQEKAHIALEMRASIKASRHRPVATEELERRYRLIAAAKEHSL